MAAGRNNRSAQADDPRWEPRLVWSLLVRAVARILPVAASVVVAALVVHLLPPARTVAQTALWVLVAVVPATTTLWLVDRLARRLLPLASLLRLSMAFPDRAPSRYRVARLTNSTRELERRVGEARARGVMDEPAEAAVTILALVTALRDHDRRTRGHSERVRLFTDLLAEELRLSQRERDRLRWGALVHDIGKLAVPGRILNKAGRPTEDEWATLREHPAEGARLCASLLPWLGEQGRAIVEHHERYDGTGYPHGLAGAEISLAGRILAVADAFEVMTSARAYKRARSAADARLELLRCAGTQFDPGVVRAFFTISLGRLRLAMGPLSWLAQWPVLSRIPQFGQSAGQAGAAVAGAAAFGAVGMLDPGALWASGSAGQHAAPPAPDLPVDRDASEPASPPLRRGGELHPVPDRVETAGTDAPASDPPASDPPASDPPASDAPADAPPAPAAAGAPARTGDQPLATAPSRQEPEAEPTPADRPAGDSGEDGRSDVVGETDTTGSAPLRDTVESTVEVVGGAVEGTVGAVGGAVEGSVGAVGGAVEGTVGAVGGAVEGTVEALGGGLDGAVEGTVEAVGGGVQETVDAVGGAVDGTVDAAGGAVGDLTGTVRGLLGGR